MLFWIMLIVCIIGSALWVLYNKNDDLFYAKHYKLYRFIEDVLGNWIGTVIAVTTVLCGLVIIISFMLFGVNACERDTMYAQYKERYKAITYKVESGACRDELGLLSKDVIDEVQEWNEEIISAQVGSKNPWVGIYYKDFWDEFSTIDYDRYNTNNTNK